MKKKFLLLLCLMLSIFCLTLSVNSTDATISVNTVDNGQRGGTVIFAAVLGTKVEVSAIEVHMSYDTDTLVYDTVTWKVDTSKFASSAFNKDEGAAIYASPAQINGTLFEVTFNVKNDAPFGTTDVKLDVKLYDKNDDLIPVINYSGKVTVSCVHRYTRMLATSAYEASKATCTEAAKYYKSCEYCGEAGSETFSSGALAPHKYEVKLAESKYLCAKATCKAKALYYYSCVCGKAGTDSFEYGDLAPHVYDNEIVKDSLKKSDPDCENGTLYYKSCDCGAVGSETFEVGSGLGHTGGTATCSEQAVCSRCGGKYGSTLPHSYTEEVADSRFLNSEESCTAKATYFKSCKCGKAGSETFTVGTNLDHTFDQKVTSEFYLKAKPSCTEKATYYYSCKCGEKGTGTFEADAAYGHSYSNDWSSDENGHWHECTECGDRKDEGTHTPGAPATEQNAQTCTVCPHIITPQLSHTVHNYSDRWTSDSMSHWHACSGCSERKDQTRHVYENECDTDCNVCGHVRGVLHIYKTKWFSDENGHWHECSVCNKKIDEASHKAGAEATEDNPQTCTVCAYVITQALDHEHSFDEETWESDEEGHWHGCSCGEGHTKEPHNWNEGEKINDESSEDHGKMLYTCTDCGAIKIEALAESTTTAATTEDAKANIITTFADEDDGGCNSDLSIIIIIIVILILVAVAMIIFSARKKETDIG